VSNSSNSPLYTSFFKSTIMFLTPSKKIALVFLTTTIIALSLFFISCQKELSGAGIDLGDTPPDLTTKIASSVSGFVTDENEVAVNGAAVQFGSSNTTTDKYGYFEVRNVQVTQEAAVVTVIKPGYFKGIKTYIATAGKSAFFRIKLLPKSTAGNIDAATGGSVALSNGLSVSLPAGAVVNAANNTAYSGPVTVAAQWLNPAAADIWRAMPGDLRGLDNNGYLKLLQTYGMSAIELTGSSGELLQIATGKKATVNFPLSTAVAGTAPASIPLWYFDETKGLWKEEGSAVKSGNNYVGEVSHFSYWNCDIPLEKSVQFELTVVDANGNPMPFVTVYVNYSGGSYTGAHGSTDSSGYINGRIPANASLVIEIYADNQCNGPVYSQSVTTGTTDISFGNITLTGSKVATVSGSVTDCSNAPVTNGYVLMKKGYYNYRTNVNPDGTFDFNAIICTGNTSAEVIAVDNNSQEQSSVINVTLTEGANSLGGLKACGISIEESITYTVDGNSFTLSAPGDFLAQRTDSIAGDMIYIAGANNINNLEFSFSNLNIAQGSTQQLTYFTSTQTGQTNAGAGGAPVVNVNITEYGAVGQFIAGNFTGTVKDLQTSSDHTVTCNFRVRRKQ
jgi:hypothetical protein